MSTQGADSLSNVEIRWGITVDELHRRERMHVDASADTERVCLDCGRRVTILDDGTEAGHSRGRKDDLCPHYAGPFPIEEANRPEEQQSTVGDW